MSRFTSERFCALVESGDVHKICDEFDALLTSHAGLLAALEKLSAEVGGLRAFEQEMRALVGNANWGALSIRLRDADAVISRALGQ